MKTETFNEIVGNAIQDNIATTKELKISSEKNTMGIDRFIQLVFCDNDHEHSYKVDIKALLSLLQNKALELTDNRIDLSSHAKSTLINKAKEYAVDDDRLYNFKDPYNLTSLKHTDILKGYMLKHAISVLDMLSGKLKITDEMVLEKFGDLFNYCLLLLALLVEDV